MGSKMLRLDQLNHSSPPIRRTRSEAGFQKLKRSIEKYNGPISPLIVSPLGDRKGKQEYVVVSGDGRLKAMEDLAFSPKHLVPCLVFDMTDEESWEYGIVDNTVRENLTPYELAAAARTLVIDYDRKHTEVAERLGLNQSSISKMVRIFDLDRKVISALRQGKIELGHAKALLKFKADPKLQKEWLTKTIARDLTVSELRDEISYSQGLKSPTPTKVVKPGNVTLTKTAQIKFRTRSRGQLEVTFTMGKGDNLDKIITSIRKRFQETRSSRY